MKGKLKEIVFPIKDEEQWATTISAENKKVTVIDLYFPCFGRCDALDEVLRAFYNNIDGAEDKLQFLYVDITKIPALKDSLKSSAKPHFRIYLVRPLICSSDRPARCMQTFLALTTPCSETRCES